MIVRFGEMRWKHFLINLLENGNTSAT
jgi:hypothetical protein